MELWSEEYDLVWLAGILEGEGYFHLYNNHAKNNKTYQYARICLCMTDRDVIEKACSMWKCKIQTCKPYGTSAKKIQYKAIIGGSNAISWMQKLKPFMGKRRTEKIEEILKFCKEKPDFNKSRILLMKSVAETRNRDILGKFI